jgi:hypothetical protein
MILQIHFTGLEAPLTNFGCCGGGTWALRLAKVLSFYQRG